MREGRWSETPPWRMVEDWKDVLQPGRTPKGPKFFSHDLVWQEEKKRLSMEVAQIQDGPSEAPPGPECKRKKNPRVWICSFCQAELKQRLGCEIRSFWDGEAPGIERRRGARGTGGCKGSRTMRKGFGGGMEDVPGRCCFSRHRLGKR